MFSYVLTLKQPANCQPSKFKSSALYTLPSYKVCLKVLGAERIVLWVKSLICYHVAQIYLLGGKYMANLEIESKNLVRTGLYNPSKGDCDCHKADKQKSVNYCYQSLSGAVVPEVVAIVQKHFDFIICNHIKISIQST